MKRWMAVLAFGVSVIWCSSTDAQMLGRSQPVRRLDQWLGLGNGHGYHWRTPGPDSSYYSPYSPLNSHRLIGAHSVGQPLPMSALDSDFAPWARPVSARDTWRDPERIPALLPPEPPVQNPGWPSAAPPGGDSPGDNAQGSRMELPSFSYPQSAGQPIYSILKR